jgi:hypothetical protein
MKSVWKEQSRVYHVEIYYLSIYATLGLTVTIVVEVAFTDLISAKCLAGCPPLGRLFCQSDIARLIPVPALLERAVFLSNGARS